MSTNSGSIVSLSKLFDTKIWNANFLFRTFLNSNSEIELYMIDIGVNSLASAWHYTLTCSSTCPVPDYTYSDFDQTNVHLAANFPSEGKVLMMVLVAASGNRVGDVKITQSSQQLALGSLSSDSNSITWVSVYSTSSSYSELIKYDSASNNYTVYQQTGISYASQYIDSSNNDNWLGLGKSLYISNTTQTCMSNVNGLTVSTTTSGLDDALSTFNIASSSGVTYDFVINTPNVNASITSAASDMDYVYAVIEAQTNSTNQTTTNQTITNQTNDNKDDDLSTGEIIGLTLGPIFGIALVVVIAFTLIYIYRKKTNSHGRSQVVNVDAQRDSHSRDHIEGHAEGHTERHVEAQVENHADVQFEDDIENLNSQKDIL